LFSLCLFPDLIMFYRDQWLFRLWHACVCVCVCVCVCIFVGNSKLCLYCEHFRLQLKILCLKIVLRGVVLISTASIDLFVVLLIISSPMCNYVRFKRNSILIWNKIIIHFNKNSEFFEFHLKLPTEIFILLIQFKTNYKSFPFVVLWGSFKLNQQNDNKQLI